MVNVSYDHQTINSPNPLQRFAHRRRMHRSIELANYYLPRMGVVADFGAGPGFFLISLADKRPDVKNYAIEPYMPPAPDSRLFYLPDLNSLSAKVDLITSLEVCEHLSDQRLDDFLINANNFIKDGGKLLISVPIMIGGALFLKEISRMILFRRKSDYSLMELIFGTFGFYVPRASERLSSHKGFDFRELRKMLSINFKIEKEILSPFPFAFPWWTNSQIFFVLSKK